MKMRGIGFITVLLLSTANSALACSPLFLSWWQNKSARPAADCSFRGGGRHDWTSGEAARDLGGGRVMQIIHDLHSPEQALISDCNTAENIAVFNPDGSDTSCGFHSSIDEHIAPDGVLNLSRGDNLSVLSAYVETQGYSTGEFTWVSGNAGDRVRPRDIPDYLCGCKLFYPDSIGATQ